MRTWAEISFRLRQEAVNFGYLLRPPRLGRTGSIPAMAPLLPDPKPICARLRGTAYAEELDRLARQILDHRFPLFGGVVDTGRDIAWNRDHGNGKEFPNRWFRRVPYLDFDQVGDHKAIWELNRHQHLVLLAQAWRLTGRVSYLNAIGAHLEHWMDRNPYGQGMQWTSALEVAFRLLSWLWAWHLAAEALPDQLRARWAGGLFEHGAFLANNLSVYFSPNTHLLGEAVALHALGRLFPTLPGAAGWAALGGRIVAQEMDNQMRADGSHFEQSSYYHVYAIDFFLLHSLLETVTPAYRERLAKAADYLKTLLGPAGRIPLLGDDDGGRLFHPYGERAAFGRATMAACAHALGRADWPNLAADRAEMAAWWLGVGALDAAETPWMDAEGEAYYADAGVYSLTRGRRQLIVDTLGFGAFGAGHSHASALSMVLRDGETEILIDPGAYTYVADPEARESFRGTRSHNTVWLAGRDQADAAGPFRWRDKPGRELHGWDGNGIDASCVQRGVRHRRRIEWRDGEIVVVDECEGEGVASWHTPLEVRELESGVFELGGVAWLRVAGGVVEESWRSTVHGSKERAWVIRAALTGGRLETRIGFGEAADIAAR